MHNTKNPKSRLDLRRESVRVLSTTQVTHIFGGRRRNDCCELDTELLNPFTNNGGPCCDLTTQLLNPYTG